MNMKAPFQIGTGPFRSVEPKLPAVVQRAQTFAAVSGMSRWVMPHGASASITALATAGVEPIVAASPMPLAPSGLMWRRRRRVVRLEHREVLGVRHGVVVERAGEQLAVVVVDAPPPRAPGRCPAPARRGPARSTSIGLMMLPQSSTETELQQLDLAGLGEDLDHGDVGAEREGLVRHGLKKSVVSRPALDVVGQVAAVGLVGDLRQRQRLGPARP